MAARRAPLAPLGLLALGLVPGLGAALRDGGPNAADYDRIERGYYERLIEPPRRDASARPADAPFDAGILASPVADVREYVLKPGLVARHKGATWTTNALGLRDRAYPEAKPPGTLRVALVGDSIAVGWGVDDGLGFEPTVERAWDARSVAAGGPHVEVLNFAVPGHAPGQRWEHASRLAWPTGPDLVVVEATLADLGWDERRLRALLPRGLGPDAPTYREALAAAGLSRTIPPDPEALKARLRPHREAILAGVYRRIVEDCRSREVAVAWVLLPRVGKAVDPASRARLVGLARSAGFDRVVDLADAFAGHSAPALAIAPDDFHPNARGHALLAGRIDEAIGEFVSAGSLACRPLGQGEPARSARSARADLDPPATDTTAGAEPR